MGRRIQMWRRDGLILGSVAFLAAVLSACGSGPAPFTSHTSVTASKNPLVAQYQVQELGRGPASVWVEFGTDYSYGWRTSAVPVPDGSTGPVTVVVAGMKADTTYHMRAHVDIPM